MRTPELLFCNELPCCFWAQDVSGCSRGDAGDKGDLGVITSRELLGSGGLDLPPACGDHFGDTGTGDKDYLVFP